MNYMNEKCSTSTDFSHRLFIQKKEKFYDQDALPGDKIVRHAASKLLKTATQEPWDHGKQPSYLAFVHKKVFDIGFFSKMKT